MTEILNEFELAVWTPGEAFEAPIVSTFSLPVGVQRTLAEQMRSKTAQASEHAMPGLYGLSEILAYFVPELAFMRVTRDQDAQLHRLHLHFLGDRSTDAAVQTAIRMGLSAWLSIGQNTLASSVRQAIAAAPSSLDSWTVRRVSRELVHKGVCPIPADRLFYDALVAKAAAALRNKAFTVGQHHGRVLAPLIRQTGFTSGLQLSVFPPVKADGEAFWSEVVSLRAATFPERPEIHLLARISIRNWGAIRSADAWDAPERTLDVFLPVDDGESISSVSFSFKAKRDRPGAALRGIWTHSKDHRVFNLLQRFTGNMSLAEREITAPCIESGLWALPRHAPGSGDRYLAGGTGVGWIDRAKIVEVLETHLSFAGFERAAPMLRHRQNLPIQRPFARRRESFPPDERECRSMLIDTLGAVGNAKNTLELLVLHTQDETPAKVRTALTKVLGKPERIKKNGTLVWPDGLRIEIVSAPAEHFSQALPDGAISQEDEARFTESQLLRIRSERRRQAQEETAAKMRSYIQSLRARPSEIACAILEMPSALRSDQRHDPYPVARNRLAAEKVLPQVLLVEADAEQTDDKYESGVRDLLRMLGVLPSSGFYLAPAALTIVQKNQGLRGGSRQSPIALAVAARVKDGILEAALPQAEIAEPEWMPYACAVLQIMSAEHNALNREKSAENRARHEHFFRRALESIDASGPAIVLVDAGKVRQHVPTFQNGELQFDRLQLDTRTLTPVELPNLRIARLGLQTSEQPFHFHRNSTKWPSGLFRWEGQERTAYTAKAKPQTVKGKALRATQLSRHDEEETASKHWPRVHAPLEETCLMFLPPGEEAMEVAVLVDRLRQVHAQYDGATRAPFPLHELQLLGRGFTHDRQNNTDDDEGDDGIA